MVKQLLRKKKTVKIKFPKWKDFECTNPFFFTHFPTRAWEADIYLLSSPVTVWEVRVHPRQNARPSQGVKCSQHRTFILSSYRNTTIENVARQQSFLLSDLSIIRVVRQTVACTHRQTQKVLCKTVWLQVLWHQLELRVIVGEMKTKDTHCDDWKPCGRAASDSLLVLELHMSQTAERVGHNTWPQTQLLRKQGIQPPRPQILT